MKSYKMMRKLAKDMLSSRDSAIRFLQQHIGIDITKKGFFRVRPDDKTPSCYINKDGSFHDFGSGEHYSDMVSLLYDGYHAFNSPNDSLIWVYEQLNIQEVDNEHQPNIDIEAFKLTQEQVNDGAPSSQTTPLTTAQIEEEFNRFEQLDLNNPTHFQVMHNILPAYLLRTSDSESLQQFNTISRIDKDAKQYVVGCFKGDITQHQLISYKHRYRHNIKWFTRKGTSANKYFSYRIRTANQPIYVIEGHRDKLTALLLGLDFIMIPNAGFQLKNTNAFKQLIANRKVVYIVEDKHAFKCMSNIALLTESVTEQTILWQPKRGEKMDLTDLAYQHNTIVEVLNALQSIE